MLKQIFISGSLLISSMSAYADVSLYKIDIKEKIDEGTFSVTTPMGSIIPFQRGGNPLKNEKCSIVLNNGTEKTEFETNQLKSDNNTLTVSAYPISIEGDKVKFLLAYSKQDMMVSKESENFMKIGDNCNLHNSVVHSVSTDVNWAGELTLGKTFTIPVSSNNSIDVTITEIKTTK
jgi:hypothetical protein